MSDEIRLIGHRSFGFRTLINFTVATYNGRAICRYRILITLWETNQKFQEGDVNERSCEAAN